jgi:hypothetical protein
MHVGSKRDGWKKPFFFAPLLGGLAVLSCAKHVIAEREKAAALVATEPPVPAPQRTNAAGTGVLPPPTAVPTAAPTAVPTAPPPERIIRLTVAQVQPESWWNSCLYLKINDGNEVPVGCGQDAGQIGKVIELPARKDFCNLLKVRMAVTTGCPQNNCVVKTWNRESTLAADKSFFKFVEGPKMFPADADIRPEASVAAALEATSKQADTYVKAQVGNTWLRMWFEDQTENNYSLWQADKTKWQETGIDFNDYVFDLKGENVAFTVDGSGLPCVALPPPQPSKP